MLETYSPDIDQLLGRTDRLLLASNYFLTHLNDEQPPFQISLDGAVYARIPETENFYDPNIPRNFDGSYAETFTLYNIMEKHYPLFKQNQCYTTVDDDFFYNLGPTAQMKIIRAAQKHHYLPETNPAITRMIPLFKELYTDHGISHFHNQFGSCLWAVGNMHRPNMPIDIERYMWTRSTKKYENEDPEINVLWNRAAALLLHYGWVSRWKIPALPFSTQYKLEQVRGGVRITIGRPMLFQDRMHAACMAALKYWDFIRHKMQLATFQDVLNSMCAAFFYQNGWYTSIDSAYRQVCLVKMTEWCGMLIGSLNGKIPQVPSIDEPDHVWPESVMDEEQHIVKYSSITFSEKKPGMMAHNQAIGRSHNKDSLAEKFKNYKPGDTLTTKEIEAIASNKSITSAIKNGFITKPKRGVFMLDASLFERS